MSYNHKMSQLEGSVSPRDVNLPLCHFKGHLGVALCDLLCSVCPWGSLLVLGGPHRLFPIVPTVMRPVPVGSWWWPAGRASTRSSTFTTVAWINCPRCSSSGNTAQRRISRTRYLSQALGDRCFTLGLVCWGNEALSSCHQVRQGVQDENPSQTQGLSRTYLSPSIPVLPVEYGGRPSRRLT